MQLVVTAVSKNLKSVWILNFTIYLTKYKGYIHLLL